MQTLLFLGGDKRLLQKIFFHEGLLITAAGALSGLLFGLLICCLQIKFKLIPFSEGFVVDAYPVKIIPMDVALVLVTVLLIGTLAAWYPIRVFVKKL